MARSMARRRVHLHRGPREAIAPALDALAKWFDLDAAVIGGGTALEARWHHRRSTDIDLFVPVPYLAGVMRLPERAVESAFRAWSGSGTESAFGPSHLHFMMSGVPVSLSGTSGFWQEDHDPCAEFSTGIPLAPSADILLRKMQGRTLAQGRAVPRDAYDFVVGQALDPVAFRDAVAQLDEDQTEAIARILERDASVAPDERGIDDPAYPDILTAGLWGLAALAFRRPEQRPSIGQRAGDDRDG